MTTSSRLLETYNEILPELSRMETTIVAFLTEEKKKVESQVEHLQSLRTTLGADTDFSAYEAALEILNNIYTRE